MCEWIDLGGRVGGGGGISPAKTLYYNKKITSLQGLFYTQIEWLDKNGSDNFPNRMN